MKSLIPFIITLSFGLFAQADSFDTVVNGISYTCTSNQPVTTSSCSARGASHKQSCNVNPASGCSVSCASGETAKCWDAEVRDFCYIEPARCSCY